MADYDESQAPRPFGARHSGKKDELTKDISEEGESPVAALRLALWRCPCAPTLRSPHTRNPAPTAPSSTFPCRKQWALANHVVALPLLLRGRRLRLRGRRRPVRPHALPYRLITTDAALIARPEPLADAHPCTARLATSPSLSGPCALRALCPPLPYALRTPLFLALRSSQQKARLAAPHTRLAALIARPAQLWLTLTPVLRCGSSPCCSGCGAGRPGCGWPRYGAAPLQIAPPLLPRL